MLIPHLRSIKTRDWLPNFQTLTSLIKILENYSSTAAKFEFSKSKVLKMLHFSATLIMSTLTILLR